MRRYTNRTKTSVSRKRGNNTAIRGAYYAWAKEHEMGDNSVSNVLFTFRKLHTELNEAEYGFREKKNYREAYDDLAYLVKDGKYLMSLLEPYI